MKKSSTPQKALELIEKAASEKAKILDLGDIGLTSFPLEIFELKEHLQVLDLGGEYFDPFEKKIKENNGYNQNKLESIPDLSILAKLISLSVSGKEFKTNKITELDFVKNLHYLEYLSFKSIQVSDLSPLKELKSLSYLNFSRNKVSDLSPLKELKSLSYLNFKSNQVSDLSPLKELKSLSHLYFNSNQVSDLSPLKELKSLRGLSFHSNRVSDLSPLKELKSLGDLNFSDNQVSDLSPLKELKSLRNLNFSDNQVSDLSPLKELKSLRGLSFHSNRVSDLSPLKELKSLSQLYFNSNLVSDLSPLKELKSLSGLDFSGNQVSDLSPLKELKSLSQLYFNSNLVSDLSPLKELKSLSYLNFQSNQVSDLSPLKELKSLRGLSFHSNRVSDLSPLKELKSLSDLNFSGNQVSDLLPLKELKSLSHLYFNSNQVSDLSPILGVLKDKFIHIETEGNPFIKPPIEFVEKGNKSIVQWFEDLARSGGTLPLNECKVIFLGEGSVGKTSLMKRIAFDKFDENEKMTHGINKIGWSNGIVNEVGEKIRVNLWDFGGQDIQHSLHQFFLANRVVYILVLNPRTDSRLSYWLDQIYSQGAESQVFVVFNWRDEGDKQINIDAIIDEAKKKYQNLIGPYLLSCKTGEGLEAFVDKLKKKILQREDISAQYPNNWFDIKQKLENEVSLEKHYVELSQYSIWCNELEYSDVVRQKELLKELDRIGSIVFFDEPILEKLHVLNPEWITTGAYAIMTSEITSKNHGHITLNDLKEIFSSPKTIFSNSEKSILYAEPQFDFILALMIKFSLCARHSSEGENHYLIPSALAGSGKDFTEFKSNAKEYRFQFDTMYEMIVIHRFIARNLHRVIGDDFWQSGIRIKHEISNTEALVETNQYEKTIYCWIKGENIRALWESIRTEMFHILKGYNNLKLEEQVAYEDGGKIHYLSYSKLMRTYSRGITLVEYDMDTDISNLNILKALEDFEPREKSTQVLEVLRNSRSHQTIEVNPTINIQVDTKALAQAHAEINLKVDVQSNPDFIGIRELLSTLLDQDKENKQWQEAILEALSASDEVQNANTTTEQRRGCFNLKKVWDTLKAISDGRSMIVTAEWLSHGQTFINNLFSVLN
jgi:internalin A